MDINLKAFNKNIIFLDFSRHKKREKVNKMSLRRLTQWSDFHSKDQNTRGEYMRAIRKWELIHGESEEKFVPCWNASSMQMIAKA